MAFVDWSSKYTVHDPELDRQHQHLFAVISELHKALLSNHSKEQIGQTIAELLEYTRSHFAAEEQLMAAYGYPGLFGHKLAHEKLLQHVNRFEAEFRDDTHSVAPDLFVFLVKDWLTGHIVAMDKNYALFFSSVRRAAKPAATLLAVE